MIAVPLTRNIHSAYCLTMVVTMVSEMASRIFKASEFKAKCLKLMDEVAATGETIIVTKNGRPVVEVRAAVRPKKEPLRPASQPDPDSRRPGRLRDGLGDAALTLVDTQAIVWLDTADVRLGAKARALIDSALSDGELAISAVSFCEVAWLLRAGRLTLPMATPDWRVSLLAAGMREVPLDGEIAIAAVELPEFHKDPADRLMSRRRSTRTPPGHLRHQDPRLARTARTARRPPIAGAITAPTSFRHSSTRSSRCTISARPR